MNYCTNYDCDYLVDGVCTKTSAEDYECFLYGGVGG
jgi:hypothetical protein